MGSLEAMKEGSAARYGHLKTDLGKKSTAEGIEALKELAGSASETLNVPAGGIRSGMGYLGASDLSTKENARFVRVTPAGQRESSTHDVIEIKTPIFLEISLNSMKSTINELFHPLVSVMGISMGDEGKGRVVHEILDLIENHTGESATGVMKVNGGANAGHTAAGLKLNLLPLE